MSGILERVGEVDGETLSRRDAAEDMMRRALARFAPEAAASAVFAACERLSAETYERQHAEGSLLLSPRDHPSMDVLAELTAPIPLQATRAARKALQLCRGRVAPLCDGASIWGVGVVARPYDASREDLLEVRFAGRARWELRHAGATLFVVAGRPADPPRPALERDRLAAAMRSVFPRVEAAGLARVGDAVATVLEAGCGITVVVSEAAAAEARRLSGQGTPIAPRVLDPEGLQAATGIGGALLLDPAGTTHAMGVILDGVAGGRGRPSRGSRFNSAAAYVAGRSATLAIVVSDDGSVDLLAP